MDKRKEIALALAPTLEIVGPALKTALVQSAIVLLKEVIKILEGTSKHNA